MGLGSGARSRRRFFALLAAAVVAAAVTAVVVLSLGGNSSNERSEAASTATHTSRRHGSTRTSHPRPATPPKQSAQGLAELVGQIIVARFTGPQPPASFLARIRAGQIGGVILFSDNLTGGLSAAAALTSELQRAASAGHRPPLLIMTDQEGGEVKRLVGPPTIAPADMTSTSVAYDQGQAAGRLLRSVGINVDLAPVADVERVAGSFLGTRSFGSDPTVVAQRACAFARGLASEHVAYTLKHFPGLGRATASTDFGSVTIDAPAASLRADYKAYQECGSSSLALVMVSSAIYPSLTGALPAVMSPSTYQHELPLATGGASVVTISDDLQTPAIRTQSAPARHAINAGLDLAMYAQTPEASSVAYTILLDDARSGALSISRIKDADQAIISLKRLVGP
jgi:beta-N-acetylhexosaminidase